MMIGIGIEITQLGSGVTAPPDPGNVQVDRSAGVDDGNIQVDTSTDDIEVET